MTFTRLIVRVGLLLSAALVPVLSAHAQLPFVEITEVQVDSDNDTITIHGKDFDFGTRFKVRLGDPASDNDITSNCTTDFTLVPQQIVCDLSLSGGLPPPGDYRLKVTTGQPFRKKDEFEVTIGAVGPQGEQGPAGAVGPQGEQGLTGAVGPQGEQGPAGVAGAQGEQGPAGAVGPQGEQGLTGAVGPQGEQGPAGVAGAQGEQGPAGVAGAQGEQGPAGVAGAQGEQGPQGEAGDSVLADLASDSTTCPIGSVLYLASANNTPTWTCLSVAALRDDLSGRKAFVTSLRYTGDLVSEANTALGTTFGLNDGTAAADALCQAAADDASLSGSFVAWLSVPGSNAIDRLGDENVVGYAMTNGTFIAENTADLLDGLLGAPLGIDESGMQVSTGGFGWTVWTNTVISGREGSGGGFTCQGFTNSTSGELGVVGDVRNIGNGSGAPTGSWTRANNLPCNQSARLYCFQK